MLKDSKIVCCRLSSVNHFKYLDLFRWDPSDHTWHDVNCGLELRFLCRKICLDEGPTPPPTPFPVEIPTENPTTKPTSAPVPTTRPTAAPTNFTVPDPPSPFGWQALVPLLLVSSATVVGLVFIIRHERRNIVSLEDRVTAIDKHLQEVATNNEKLMGSTSVLDIKGVTKLE